MTYYIYVLIDPRTNEERYVGQTIKISRRYSQHCSQINKRTRCARWIKGLIKLELKPIIKVIDKAESLEEADSLEIYHIKWRKEARYNLTNLTIGGKSGAPFTGHKHTEEWCINHSKAVSGKNHPLYGKAVSEETRRKQSESHKGYKYTEERKALMREKYSGKNAIMYGKNHTEEAKQKMRGNNHHSAKLTEEDVLNIKRLLLEGASGAELSRTFNVSPSTICMIRTGKVWGWLTL